MPSEPQPAKYIILRFAGEEFALVFPWSLQHSHMLPHDIIAMAAGFCQVLPGGGVVAFGESETLKLKARPQDGEIIQRLLGTEEVER